ncbi:MAG TPA: HAD family acid phosphatase [Kofleriaceae bacterium]|nr:HAD family acid phosphatase [Kofleriaceae bacterium]
MNVEPDGRGAVSAAAIPDVRCTGTPSAPAGEFRHLSSKLVAKLGDPRHRGFDLIAAASAGTQTLEGWLAYSGADKALEDEDVDLFACVDNAWAKLGTARSDGEGHFTLALTAAVRLPVGMRDLYASVVGDRTGTAFLAYVAPEGSPLIVSDVDGTLTSSENAFIETIANGEQADPQAGASAAFRGAAARGYQLVYVTARGNQYTGDTRQWLADRGFPRGPLRLSPSFVTLPGGDTVDFKTHAIKDVIATGLSVVMGVGNRASDITAYANVGLAGTQTLIKLPEYQSEVQSALDAGQAIGFAAYDDLRVGAVAALPSR